MKGKIWYIAFLLLLPCLMLADDYNGWKTINLGEMDFPRASVDNLFTPLVNPSLLGTGHTSGLGWAHTFSNEAFRNHYWFLANLGNFSYTYEYNRDPISDNSFNYHTLASGGELFPRYILPNLYGGLNYRWKNNKFSEGAFRTVFTYRPNALASIAFNWDNPYKDSPAYHGSVAFRPFAFVPSIKDYRLEISADVDYNKKDGEYKFNEPVIGLNTQLVDGITLGASYNLDTETTWANFSLNFNKVSLGSTALVNSNDYVAVPYIHLTEKSFPPFLGIKDKKWYSMKLEGPIQTYKSPKFAIKKLKIYESKIQSIEDVEDILKQAKEDPVIEGILLQNPASTGSFALQQEFIEAIKDFKESGKKVAFYYDNISGSNYILASSVADAIYLNPMGMVDLRGISITSPYFKELLDTLGIDVLNFRSHKYKDAGNMFSEPEMTEAEKEAYDSLLQSIYDQIVISIQEGRGSKLKASVEETIDNGPYFKAQDALNAGLIDGIIFADELNNELKKQFGFASRENNLAEYIDYDWCYPKETPIAMIYACGNIVMGKGTPGTKIASETTVDLIRKARLNPKYKGIILRVDSGGGSAQASDLILRELELTQKVNKKPVVVSMSGVAASGGYYISCGADRIIAEPSTLTGSIGVVGIVFTFPRLYDKIGINWSTVKKGEHADFGATYRDWTNEEKQILNNNIEFVYDRFIDRVDEGRTNLTRDQIHNVAQGRVWTGAQAKENGLIDDLGGLDKAVEHMRELTGTKGKLVLEDATTSKEGFTLKLNFNFETAKVQNISSDQINSEYKALYEFWRDYQNESVLMLCPVSLKDIEF